MVSINNAMISAINILITLRLVKCDCVLRIKQDFGTPQPIMIKNGTLMTPNIKDGVFKIKAGNTINIACTGPRAGLIFGRQRTYTTTTKLECMTNNRFQSDDWEGPYKDLRCKGHPMFSVEETDVPCYGTSQMYRVGYKAFNKFYTLYEACFDAYLLATHYVKHQLSPASFFKQGGKKPSYTQGKIFPELNMDNVYLKKTEFELMTARFGPALANRYITESQYLARCLLAPRGDFSMYNHQRATYHYINVAPQWASVNRGDWDTLESALRLRIKLSGKTVSVYTGVHGDLTLQDESQYHKPLYMHKDNENNYFIPVPLYFFKVVYNEEERLATAFVLINNDNYSETELKALKFCRDVCMENIAFDWLRKQYYDNCTLTFCCTFDEFRNTVKNFPKFPVYGLFT